MTTYTTDDVTQLLGVVLNGIRTGVEDRVYTLEEVAERTHFSLRALQHGCRAERIEHTRDGKFRGMTPRQVAVLLARRATGGDLSDNDASSDELTEARDLSRKGGAQRASRRAA